MKATEAPSASRQRSRRGNTKEVVVVEAVEVVPAKSTRKGKVYSLPKSKRKIVESSVEEALEKNLLASAIQVAEKKKI